MSSQSSQTKSFAMLFGRLFLWR